MHYTEIINSRVRDYKPFRINKNNKEVTMKRFKRSIALFLAAVMLMGAVGCSQKAQNGDKETKSPETTAAAAI